MCVSDYKIPGSVLFSWVAAIKTSICSAGIGFTQGVNQAHFSHSLQTIKE